MARQMQIVIYEGNLVADPEAQYTANGTFVCNFRMGSNQTHKSASGEIVKETTWLKVAVWGKTGEFVNKYAEKGSHVVVTGRLRVGEGGNPTVYELNKGGFGASYEITASDVRILKGKPFEDEDGSSSSTDEEIPF